MRVLSALVFALVSSLTMSGKVTEKEVCDYSTIQRVIYSTTCVSFSVGSGTGCSWMCQYCANQLGTNNYYFTDGVCTYQEGGCVGTPQTGVTYTCCAN
jgi:hypothetical protein